MNDDDTIVAIATAPGRAAIGVVRLSGPGVPRIAAAMLGQLPRPRHATRCAFRAADGGPLDEGLALYFPAPASYTGEAVLELQGHGGAVVLDLLVRRLIELGCRAARPGEFSERAFLNGKLDIAQAEAVADLIDASTQAAARAAVRTLQGEFSERIAALQAELTGLRMLVEASIDFPDEDLEAPAHDALRQRVARLFAAFDALSAAARQGELLRDGLTVVIAGKPNAGKSSLMNRLAGEDLAIVDAQPGTTRDLLRHRLELDGLPLLLIDTAGLRAPAEAVEAEGIRRARREIGQADRVLYLIDASRTAQGADEPPAAELDQLPGRIPLTLVYNKIDLADLPAREQAGADPPRIYLSAKTGSGVALLRAHLKACAGFDPVDGGALSARRRHLDALRRARVHSEAAAANLGARDAPELFAEELRLAQRALGEITGEFGSDDLLGAIFASFCIGK